MTLSLPEEGDELHSALQSNLNSALRISSLLIKNEKTNFDELVHQICNLSYLGTVCCIYFCISNIQYSIANGKIFR